MIPVTYSGLKPLDLVKLELKEMIVPDRDKQMKAAVWLPSRWNNPSFFLIVIAFLTSAVVQPGNLGSVDSARRLQVARSFWTDEPPVKESDRRNFGVVGKHGQVHAWYGMGQSLLMLPADVSATIFIDSFPALQSLERRLDGKLRQAVVSYFISLSVCVCAVFAAFHFIKLLGFTVDQAVAGSLTLLFATTFLHYTQVNHENNFIFLMTLVGFYFHLRWLREGSTLPLVLGSLAFGFNLLTRLTTIMDLMAGGAVVITYLIYRYGLSRTFCAQLLRYGLVCFPIYALFLGVDRLYHYHRFGLLSGTYANVLIPQSKAGSLSLFNTFFFDTSFSKGFFGPLFSVEKSIFLFDPMIIITLVLITRYWKLCTPLVKAFVLSIILLLFSYISFYANFSFWAGDSAWGDRYITTPVQLLSMMSVPLLLHFSPQIHRSFVRIVLHMLVPLSVLVQIASVVLWFNLENHQRQMLGEPMFVVGMRFLNILAIATGKFDQWGFGKGIPDRTSQLCFMPFSSAQNLPPAASSLLLVIWLTLLIALIVVLCVFARRAFQGSFGGVSSIPSSDTR